MASVRSEKPIIMPCTPSLRRSPNVAFKTVLVFVWFTMTISRRFKKGRWALSFPRLSPPGDRWRGVRLGFVPAGSVSSSSTLQMFRDGSHMWWLFCPLVYLLGHFPSLRHDQGSTPTRAFKGGCRPLAHSSLGFPFHFSLFVAHSLNLWGWGHVWSDCHLLWEDTTQWKSRQLLGHVRESRWDRPCCGTGTAGHIRESRRDRPCCGTGTAGHVRESRWDRPCCGTGTAGHVRESRGDRPCCGTGTAGHIRESRWDRPCCGTGTAGHIRESRGDRPCCGTGTAGHIRESRWDRPCCGTGLTA